MTDPALFPPTSCAPSPRGRSSTACSCPSSPSRRCTWPTGRRRPGPAELARIARVADEAGFFYLGVCDHTAIPRRLADAMGTIWYDTTATLGWLAALTTPHPPALPRADPRPAPSAAGGQGALDPGPSLGRPPHRRRGRRSRARGVRAPDGRLRRAGPPHRRGRLRAGPRLHRRVPRAAGPALPGPGHGGRATPGAPAPPADLDRRLVAGGHPPHGRLRRRLAAPGDTAPRPARARSPGCASCATSCAAGRRSTSAPSSSPST